MPREVHLADLQLAIMQVLWDRDEATVADVRDQLEADGRKLAYTTVATMLTKLEKSGHVTRESKGRVLSYRPQLRRDQVSRSMVTDLAQKLFRGDLETMVSHLLEGCEVDQAELTRLKKLIRQKEREVKGDD
ncbi:Transcriptional regulator BlaI [Polystyrenella longa]|uniref:Transcriptional regulator BlaI n=1 Tax=Polystyrenella longa TaxID=2528007 RepID=A0A518CSR4_9PLAN|nr:BlaI/MecI/CopY family transcriptional regulator [Polystyrenella longa]QDU82272.1 Transcriptional regulator BlaI [Polystyrenella longa]